ncbi:MAG: hypothetical protein KBF73_03995 [Flavobacteriales bacterium]|nr:hypothetical protein [Flavobacteriales bacterium]
MLFDHRFTSHEALERVQYANITSLTGFLGGMEKSDVPFVYHHLRKGCILKLHAISGADNRHLMFGVNYGSYRLGILSSSMARRIQELEMNGKIYRLTIAKIVKEKYMPPTAIMVELECESEVLDKVA